MKKLISVSILLFCCAIISAQQKIPVKKTVTPQNKVQVKKPVTPQKKIQPKKQVTPQNKSQISNPVIPCKWQKNESDPFTGVSAKTTNWELVGYNTNVNADINNGLKGDYRFSISENIAKKDTSYMLWIRTSTSQNLCFNNDSKILIKSGEKILTINLLGGVLCGESITSYGTLDTSTRKFLRKHAIDLIRIQCSGEGNTPTSVDLKDVDKYAKLETGYFINTLRCFDK
jgi:hypothetical protein